MHGGSFFCRSVFTGSSLARFELFVITLLVVQLMRRSLDQCRVAPSSTWFYGVLSTWCSIFEFFTIKSILFFQKDE